MIDKELMRLLGDKKKYIVYGTYNHSVSYAMMGNTYTESETGTYKVEGTQITLTTVISDETVVMTGTVNSDGTITITRKASSKASNPVDIVYTYGGSGNSDGQEPGEGEDTSVKVKAGMYGGTYEKTAMGSKLIYNFTMEIKEDGTYNHSVSYAMMGNTYTESETGAYKVEGTQITLTTVISDETVVMTGTVNSDGTITITRKASSKAKDLVDIKYTYGFTPSVQKAEKSANKEAVTEKATEAETETVTEQMTEAAEEVTEVKTEPETEPDSEVTEAKSESETKATEVKSEPETKATEAKAEPETKATEVKSEPETKATEAKSEPETKATEKQTEAKKETESKAAEQKAEPETKATEKEQ